MCYSFSCLFDEDVHWWMVVDAKVVDHIVLPLIVATPFTEQEKVGMNPIWWLQVRICTLLNGNGILYLLCVFCGSSYLALSTHLYIYLGGR